MVGRGWIRGTWGHITSGVSWLVVIDCFLASFIYLLWPTLSILSPSFRTGPTCLFWPRCVLKPIANCSSRYDRQRLLFLLVWVTAPFLKWWSGGDKKDLLYLSPNHIWGREQKPTKEISMTNDSKVKFNLKTSVAFLKTICRNALKQTPKTQIKCF